MSTIHTKLTGKEDSYEQAVREAGEAQYRTMLKEAYKDQPEGFNVNELNLPYRRSIGVSIDDQETWGVMESSDYSKQAENKVFAEACAKMYLSQCNLLSKEQELKHKIIPVILDNLSIFSRNTSEGYELLQSHFSNDPAFMNHPDYMRLVVHEMD